MGRIWLALCLLSCIVWCCANHAMLLRMFLLMYNAGKLVTTSIVPKESLMSLSVHIKANMSFALELVCSHSSLNCIRFKVIPFLGKGKLLVRRSIASKLGNTALPYEGVQYAITIYCTLLYLDGLKMVIYLSALVEYLFEVGVAAPPSLACTLATHVVGH